ncbi:unnamed protein product, partial [Dicrocoelium dendriticum]
MIVINSCDGCAQENFPKILSVTAATKTASSDEWLVTADWDTRSTAPVSVRQKKKRTRSARKTSKELEDPGSSKASAIERKTYATVASTSFTETGTVTLPVMKTAGISVESNARGEKHSLSYPVFH